MVFVGQKTERPTCQPTSTVVITSMESSRRVVITGLGVISPLGNSPEALWSALSAGRSGVDRIRVSSIAGAVPGTICSGSASTARRPAST